jgi:hypothetical protein
VKTISLRSFISAFVDLELFLPSFTTLSFVDEIVGTVYPSASYCQISNPCACIYAFILMLQKAYFCSSNCGIPFLYKLFISMIFLSVIKLISEGTHSDTNCWITESGGEYVIEKYNLF